MATPRLKLALLCAITGIDLDDLIKRVDGPCICGHKRDEHETKEGAWCGCAAEGCGCPGFSIPPKMEDPHGR